MVAYIWVKRALLIILCRGVVSVERSKDLLKREPENCGRYPHAYWPASHDGVNWRPGATGRCLKMALCGG